MFFGSRQRSVSRTSIPVDDLEKALSQYCTPPTPDKSTGQGSNISDATFKRITDLLEHLESHQRCRGWSVRPRLYTVLRNIGHLDLFQKFIDLGFKDISFPYTVEKLPDFLQEDRLRDGFLRHQKHVLTDASQLEKGRHAYTKNADDLFLVVKHLGSGGYGYVGFTFVVLVMFPVDKGFCSKDLAGAQKLTDHFIRSVDKVWSLMSFRWFARKQFMRKKSSRADQAMLKNFENELSNLKRLSHQHLVKLVGSYTDQKCVAFLMEPIADMNLLTFLELYKPGRDDTSLRRYFGCLASAVGYLHMQRIRHRDLKPENILIKDLKVYIADFGTALDWSHKLKDTTMDVCVPATTRYMAPEVANRMPRKSSSDMWSLGVIYLEMVTVLRGRSLSALRQFLDKNGTRQPYVFANPPATTQWFEELRLNGVGPESDNEPLTWIKDLTQPDPLRRPQPWALTEQIKNSSTSTSFIGICCANDETSPDYPSPPATAHSGEDAEEVTLEEQVAAFEPSFRPFGSLIPRSSQDTVERWLGTAGVSMPGAFLDEQYFEDPHEIVENTNMEKSPYAENGSGDLEEDEIAETSTGYEITEDDSDDDDEGMGQSGYEITEDSSASELTIRPLSPSSLAGSTMSAEPATSGEQSVNEIQLHGEDPFLDSRLQKAISEYLMSVPELSDPPLAINTPAASFPELSDPPLATTTPAVNSNHLAARPGDHSPTATNLRAHIGGSNSKSIRSQRDTQHPASTPTATDAPLTGSSAVGSRDHKPLITRPLAPKVAWADKQTTGRVGRSTWESIPSQRDTQPTASTPLATNTPVTPSPSQLTTQPPQQRVEPSVASAVTARVDRKKERQRSSPHPPPPGSPTRPTAGESPIMPPVQRTNGSSLHFGSSTAGLEEHELLVKQPPTPRVARAEEPTTGRAVVTSTSSVLHNEGGLTSENLALHQAGTSRTPSTAPRGGKPKRSNAAALPPAKMMAAEDYMQQVWEAASTKATSVLSARTRQALSSLGPGVVWQDRDLHYVEQYTKLGKAAAVRELLLAGCNPGTTKKPNYRPLINAVRAGTLRHNKVVQVLLDHGANVNAVHPATGKTPLHFAIENSYFPGYTNLIRNLLEHAANPNARDRNKDTPLLQILYGGYKPLEKHKRDALACLLQPHLDTDVNVMPPGTLNMPIHLAVRRRDALAVGMLIKKGSKVNKPNGAGTTPLRMAASSCKGKIGNNDFELLRYLLESGANVNKTSGEDGSSALHLAAIQGCMQAVRLLLSHKADPKVKDKQGRTPLEAAIANKSKMSDETFAVIEKRLKRSA
ncbi:MAG: hypothetical protein Q9208_001602 [Pyrenodesmia sp. 3 TL-2023]